MLAAENGHEAIVKLRLNKGAVVGTNDNDGQTLLALATRNKYADTIQVL